MIFTFMVLFKNKCFRIYFTILVFLFFLHLGIIIFVKTLSPLYKSFINNKTLMLRTRITFLQNSTSTFIWAWSSFNYS
jgi:hypothetical protein